MPPRRAACGDFALGGIQHYSLSRKDHSLATGLPAQAESVADQFLVWMKMGLGDTSQSHVQRCARRYQRLNPQPTEAFSIDSQERDESIYSFPPQGTLKFFLHNSLSEFFTSLFQLLDRGPQHFLRCINLFHSKFQLLR